jgi:MFS family permease
MLIRQGIYILVAALCMVATFPGRTHGLGFITETVLRDLALDRTLYGYYNLWATLLGALFCIPVGVLLDRFGCRNVLIVTLACLGLSVIGMSQAKDMYTFFFTLVLTRGFGQSALSVASIALISKTFTKSQMGPSMGIYSVFTSLFFMAAFGGMGSVLKSGVDWRIAWGGIGLILLAVYIPIVLFGIRKRESTVDTTESDPNEIEGMSFYRALCTPHFWVFALSISFFGLVSSGIGLFNQDILNERGFSVETYYAVMVLGVPFGLLGNLGIGILARYIRISYLLVFSLFLSGISKFLFPWIQTETQIYAYTILLAFSGGGLSVLFFIAWTDLFGKRDVGRILGAAQMVTVFASALGPIFFAYSKQWTGTYTPAFWISGGLTLFFAVWACFLKTVQK